MKIILKNERLSELLTTYVIGADEDCLREFWDCPSPNRLTSTIPNMISGGLS